MMGDEAYIDIHIGDEDIRVVPKGGKSLAELAGHYRTIYNKLEETGYPTTDRYIMQALCLAMVRLIEALEQETDDA